MDEFKDKAEMALAFGSNQGYQCWCGAGHRASGYYHMKVFRPYSCGSEECKALEVQYQSLPKGNGHHEIVFGDLH